MALLDIRDLSVRFHTHDAEVHAVNDGSLTVQPGETLGIVGESGSGKSVSMLAVMGLLPDTATVTADQMTYDGQDILAMTPAQRRKLIGREITMIFQEPVASLNPSFTVGFQIEEVLCLNLGLSGKAARNRALELFRAVGIPEPEEKLKAYPHQMSGGQCQRVMIAIAIACQPKLIIADEPTTALDVTIQAQILELLQGLKRDSQASIIMITHDMGVIASMCSRILVMYGGTICEQGDVREIFYGARHPYTWGLLNSIPKVHRKRGEKLVPIHGTPPDMLQPPAGCPFAPRCRYCMPVCRAYMPPETALSETHRVACHLMHPKAPKVTRED